MPGRIERVATSLAGSSLARRSCWYAVANTLTGCIVYCTSRQIGLVDLQLPSGRTCM